MKKKSNVAILLCMIYFLNIISVITIKNVVLNFDNEILRKIYMLRLYRIIPTFPIIYYFFINRKDKKYFQTKGKLSIWKFINYFSLMLLISILGIVSSIISYMILKDIIVIEKNIEIPIYIDIFWTVILAPILEEIAFRGVIMNHLEKYGYRAMIIINSMLFGLSHSGVSLIIPAFLLGVILSYVAYRYSIKYSILLHMLYNMFPFLGYVSKSSNLLLYAVALLSIILIVLFIIFLITGLVKGKYKPIFSIFRLSREDRANILLFCRNNALYLIIISGIVAFNF